MHTPWNAQPVSAHSTTRIAHPLPAPPLPQPPARWVSKSVEDKKKSEAYRAPADDKWTILKAYRRSKGLCFICGEKWGRENQCKNAIQLHVVQEMIQCMQTEDTDTDTDQGTEKEVEQQLMMISVAALDSDTVPTRSMKLQVIVQGQPMLFLVDSGSSSCFLDQK